MADETAQAPPKTGLDTLPDEQLRVEDSNLNNLLVPGQDTSAVGVTQHFEEHDDVIQQSDTQLPILGVQEHFEEDDSMSFINVAIAVGKRRVRVPIQVFRDSENFYSIVKQAMSTHGPDSNSPLQLDFLNSEEAEGLWSFLKFVNIRRLTGEIMFTAADYDALLRFSTNWRFNKVRAATILNFPPVDTVSTIALARDHCIEKWLVPSLNAYARLGRSITMQDVQRLGPAYILRLVAVRETMKLVSNTPCGDQPISCTEIECRARWDPRNHLRSLFAREIELLDVEVPPVEPKADDDDFYLTELYILVENCLFQSYCQPFEASPVFRDMFSLPIQNDEVPDGSTKSQPLRLDGIKKADFKPFVTLINPRLYPCRPLTINAWISVLKLSTMWEFTAIRRLAITNLSKAKLTHVRRICLAREYRISAWFLAALSAYTQQPQRITYADVVSLGWDYVLRILQARESVLSLALASVQGTFSILPCLPGQNCGQVHQILVTPGIVARSRYDFVPAIQCVFRDEIERIRSAEQSRLGTQPSSDAAPSAKTSIDCKLGSTVEEDVAEK